MWENLKSKFVCGSGSLQLRFLVKQGNEKYWEKTLVYSKIYLPLICGINKLQFYCSSSSTELNIKIKATCVAVSDLKSIAVRIANFWL